MAKAQPIRHFLLVFDHAHGKLVHQEDFGSDVARATTAYSAMEQRHQDETQIDVVLVGSDSLETIKFTHANYFEGASQSLMKKAMALSF